MEEGSLREAAHIEPVHNNGGGSSPRLAVAAGAPPTFGGSCCPGPPSALCCACTRPCRHLTAPVFVTKQAGRLLHKLLGQTRPGGPGSRHSGAGTALELETASLPAGRWQWLKGESGAAAGEHLYRRGSGGGVQLNPCKPHARQPLEFHAPLLLHADASQVTAGLLTRCLPDLAPPPGRPCLTSWYSTSITSSMKNKTGEGRGQ